VPARARRHLCDRFFFLDKFSAWTGYQIRQKPQLGQARQRSPQVVSAAFDRACAVVRAALRDIEGLKGLLAERGS
jgi:hypothetical protein